MFSEILNGILTREEQITDASSSTAFNPPKPKMKLGIIPAGVYIKPFKLFKQSFFHARLTFVHDKSYSCN